MEDEKSFTAERAPSTEAERLRVAVQELQDLYASGLTEEDFRFAFQETSAEGKRNAATMLELVTQPPSERSEQH